MSGPYVVAEPALIWNSKADMAKFGLNLPPDLNSGRYGAGADKESASIHIGNLAVVSDRGAILLDDGDNIISISPARAWLLIDALRLILSIQISNETNSIASAKSSR
jgi:hypothetical protein